MPVHGSSLESRVNTCIRLAFVEEIASSRILPPHPAKYQYDNFFDSLTEDVRNRGFRRQITYLPLNILIYKLVRAPWCSSLDHKALQLDYPKYSIVSPLVRTASLARPPSDRSRCDANAVLSLSREKPDSEKLRSGEANIGVENSI